MKKNTLLRLFIAAATFTLYTGCSKTNSVQSSYYGPGEGYTSVSDFLNKNSTNTFTNLVSAQTGGHFTTPNGTKVIVPDSCFTDLSGNPIVKGNIILHIKDVYSKSDMLFSDLTIQADTSSLTQSGGMFYIHAVSPSTGATLIPNSKRKNNYITVKQQWWGWSPVKTGMTAYYISARQLDSIQSNGKNTQWWNWAPDPLNSVVYSPDSVYIFKLYDFGPSPDSGTWCNSGNPGYFASFHQTSITLNETDNNTPNYQTYVFLLFKDVNAILHVYYKSGNGNNFYFNTYAPLGETCTLVAVGIQHGTVYSSFVPGITITSNLVENFTMRATSTSEFKNQLSTYLR